MIEFFNYLNSLNLLSAEATAALVNVVRVRELRKGQVWLHEGAVCDKLTFVLKGLLKLYFDDGTKEMILHFARPNEIMLSAQSYFEQTASRYSIRAVEQSVVVYIPLNELQQLVSRFPELSLHLLLIAQRQVRAHEYHTGLLMVSPRERFVRIRKDHPWMVNGKCITDRLLAGYLGVGANTVCHWRKGIN